MLENARNHLHREKGKESKTMNKPRILIQLDSDRHPSIFDSVVAVDSAVDQLFRHGNVTLDDVPGLVHGAIFTRGPQDLKSTAIFIGGNDVGAGEKILARVQQTFFGPMRVSVMLDANGSNTTAVAAVLSAEKQLDLAGRTVAVLGGTGPVGRRIARLAARKGARVLVGSRTLAKSQSVCEELAATDPSWNLAAFATADEGWIDTLADGEVLFGAGAAGCELISSLELANLKKARVLIDLNAVPPAGIAGVDVMAAGTNVGDRVHYGAIGVGGLKMKIHKACIRRLFESNDLVLDADEIYDLGNGLTDVSNS